SHAEGREGRYARRRAEDDRVAVTPWGQGCLRLYFGLNTIAGIVFAAHFDWAVCDSTGSEQLDDWENRAYYRGDRPGRSISGKIAAQQRLRRPWREAALVIVQYRAHRQYLCGPT